MRMVADGLKLAARGIVNVPDSCPGDMRWRRPIESIGRRAQVGKGAKLVDQICLVRLKGYSGILLLTDVVTRMIAGTGRTGKETDRRFEGKMATAVMTFP
jgi:hypothetical protein